MVHPENMGGGSPPPTPSSSVGPGGATQNSLTDLGEEAAESKACEACSDLTAASPFPRKPQESFFEFLLILATPAPPPGTGLGEQDSRALHLAEGAFHSSAVKSQPETGREANLSCELGQRPLSSWGAATIVFLLRGGHRSPSRPGPTQTTSLLPPPLPAPQPGADFSAAGNNEWGVGAEANCITAS